MAPFTCKRCQQKYGDQKQSRTCESCTHILCNECYKYVKEHNGNKCLGCRTKYKNPTKARRAHKVSTTPLVFKRRFNVDFFSMSMMKQRLAVMFTRRIFLAKKARTKVWWDIENLRIPAELNRKHYKFIGTRVKKAIRDLHYTGAVDVIAVASEEKKISTHVQTGLRDDGSEVDLQIVEKSGKEVADLEIKRQMGDWLAKTIQSRRHGHFMLLAGDSGYLEIAECIVRSGSTFSVGYDPAVTSHKLRVMANHLLPFRELIGAPEKKSKKPKKPRYGWR